MNLFKDDPRVAHFAYRPRGASIPVSPPASGADRRARERPRHHARLRAVLQISGVPPRHGPRPSSEPPQPSPLKTFFKIFSHFILRPCIIVLNPGVKNSELSTVLGNRPGLFRRVVEQMPCIGQRPIIIREIEQALSKPPADRLFRPGMSPFPHTIGNPRHSKVRTANPQVENVDVIAIFLKIAQQLDLCLSGQR